MENAKHAFQNGSRFCRRDCGNYVNFASEPLPAECLATGEGDRCNVTCKLDTRIKYEYLCDPDVGKWQAKKRFDSVQTTVNKGSLCLDGDCVTLEELAEGKVTFGIAQDPSVAGVLWKSLDDKCRELAGSDNDLLQTCKEKAAQLRNKAIHEYQEADTGSNNGTVFDVVAENEQSKCLALYDTTSTTTPGSAEGSTGSVTGGILAVVILFPLIIVIALVMVGLYYFGYLKVFGLEVAKSKAQIYGQVLFIAGRAVLRVCLRGPLTLS